MTSPLKSYAELERYLRELPPPQTGWRRVFRGQTSHYPKLLTSACRPGAPPRSLIWELALTRLQEKLLGPVGPGRSMDKLMNLSVWFKVLAQHYGPGSPLLDVTSEPGVALWFALHKAAPMDAEIRVSGVPGMKPIPVQCAPLSFERRREAVGWFYVLDVLDWNGAGVPKHAELVDLSQGPDFVRTCERVRRQHGAVVMSEKDVGGGDLAGLFACPPIAVAGDFEGVPLLDADALELFPLPEGDAWYDHLLHAPLVLQPDGTHGFTYRQSLGVYVVATNTQPDQAQAIVRRQWQRTSVPLRFDLRANLALRRELAAATGADPEAATCIQIDVPLIRFLAPADEWNQAALASGLGRRVRPYVEFSEQKLPAVSLDNVLIELSPLEYAFEDLEAFTPFTAVWLVRQGDEWGCIAFTADSGEVDRRITPLFWTRFSPEAGAFVLARTSTPTPLLEAVPKRLVKAFFVALDLLRGLSPQVKPDPWPTMTFDGNRMLVQVRAQSTVLTRAAADPDDVRFHFLRHALSRAPYDGPTLELPSIAMLKLKTTTPFARLRTVGDLYGHVYEANENGRHLVLPPRDEAELSQATAAFLTNRYANEAP